MYSITLIKKYSIKYIKCTLGNVLPLIDLKKSGKKKGKLDALHIVIFSFLTKVF